MMMIADTSHVPPGGAFVYVQPESGVTFRHHTLPYLLEQIKKHRIANNYPIGTNFNQEIEDYICQHQPDICRDTTPPVQLTKVQVLIGFAKSMMSWASQGFALVRGDDYIARRETCMGDGKDKPQCPYWGGEPEFGFAQCAKCGCSRLKLFVKASANGQDDCPDKRWPIIQ
jgi:hypothetical protein